MTSERPNLRLTYGRLDLNLLCCDRVQGKESVAGLGTLKAGSSQY